MKPVFCAALLVFAALQINGFAQLNEDRITRDATGVYTGKIFGGTMNWVDAMGVPGTPFGGPTNLGRARVPVDEGNNSSVLRDNEVGGDDSATVKGKAKNATILRGGKLIRTGGRGGAVNPGSGSSLTGAKADGTFTDRGPKWQANFGGQASQVFDIGGRWVYSGRKVTGKG